MIFTVVFAFVALVYVAGPSVFLEMINDVIGHDILKNKEKLITLTRFHFNNQRKRGKLF